MGGTRPDEARLIAAVERTWPPVAVDDSAAPGWRLREGAGGGRRVSCASSLGGEDFEAAAAAMRAHGARPCIRAARGEAELAARLEAADWVRIDPTVLMVGEAARLVLVDLPKGVKFSLGRIRLALLDEIWEGGAVTPARRAVMARAPEPKATIMARTDAATAGVGFVCADGEVAMLHAVVVREALRRQGAGTAALAGAARFALDVGAQWVGLAVTEANAAARALYGKAGMTEVGGYAYWEPAEEGERR